MDYSPFITSSQTYIKIPWKYCRNDYSYFFISSNVLPLCLFRHSVSAWPILGLGVGERKSERRKAERNCEPLHFLGEAETPSVKPRVHPRGSFPREFQVVFREHAGFGFWRLQACLRWISAPLKLRCLTNATAQVRAIRTSPSYTLYMIQWVCVLSLSIVETSVQTWVKTANE